MIGIIVTGHGNFASGLTSSLDLIAGKPEQYVAVDFKAEFSIEDLERELHNAWDALHECEGILVLSDLLGGSPFKTAVMIAQKKEKVEIVAGTNLPMLIEVNMARKFVEDVASLANMAVTTGKDQVLRYEYVPYVQEEPMDGI